MPDHQYPPSLLRVLRMMYWAAGRDRKRIPHLRSVLWSFIRNWFLLRTMRHVVDRRAPVAIALMDRLGDIVSVEPVARYARSRYPDRPIFWFTSVPYAELPKAFGAVDRVVTVQCLTEWALLRSTSSFAEVMDLHFSGVYCLKCVVSFEKPGAASSITAESHYNFGNQLTTRCRCAGIPPITGGPELALDGRLERSPLDSDLAAPFVVIHCAASEANRDWRDENWRKLADFIADDMGMSVVEIGSFPRVIRANQEKRRNLCGALSILETAEVIRRAVLYVGIDSGPAHLANAVRTRGIILLGHFRGLERYMPYSGPYETGELADLIWAEGPVADLPVARVIDAVKRRLENFTLSH